MLKVNRRDYPKHLYGNGMARPYREVGNRVVAGDVGMFKKSLSVLLVASLIMLSSAITSSEEKVDSFRLSAPGRGFGATAGAHGAWMREARPRQV